MNYIFFNEDGSIKKTNFTDSIQQNDDGSDKIFVSIDGIDYSDFGAVGVFVLPDGTVSEEGADFESDYEYASGETADGFVITLTVNETKLPGVVFLTLQIIEDSTNKTKYTYRVALTINESASLSSLTLITLAQYNALKSYIDSNYLKRTYTFSSDTLLTTILSTVGDDTPFIFKFSYTGKYYLACIKKYSSTGARFYMLDLLANNLYKTGLINITGVTLLNVYNSYAYEIADKAWVSANAISKLYKHTITIEQLQWGGVNHTIYPGQRATFSFYNTEEDAYTSWSDLKDAIDEVVSFFATYGTANEVISGINFHGTGYGTILRIDVSTGEDIIPVKGIEGTPVFSDNVTEL